MGYIFLHVFFKKCNRYSALYYSVFELFSTSYIFFAPILPFFFLRANIIIYANILLYVRIYIFIYLYIHM